MPDAPDPEADVAPDAAQARSAHDLAARLAPFLGRGLRLRSARGEPPVEVDLTPRVLRLLVRVLEGLGAGRAVSVEALRPELTTQEAADVLGVSRPHLVAMLERGELPHRRVGTHRRVLREDVQAYRARQQRERRAALDELSAIGQELGLDD